MISLICLFWDGIMQATLNFFKQNWFVVDSSSKFKTGHLIFFRFDSVEEEFPIHIFKSFLNRSTSLTSFFDCKSSKRASLPNFCLHKVLAPYQFTFKVEGKNSTQKSSFSLLPTKQSFSSILKSAKIEQNEFEIQIENDFEQLTFQIVFHKRHNASFSSSPMTAIIVRSSQIQSVKL